MKKRTKTARDRARNTPADTLTDEQIRALFARRDEYELADRVEIQRAHASIGVTGNKPPTWFSRRRYARARCIELLAAQPKRAVSGPQLAVRGSGRDCGAIYKNGEGCIYVTGHDGEHFDGRHKWRDKTKTRAAPPPPIPPADAWKENSENNRDYRHGRRSVYSLRLEPTTHDALDAALRAGAAPGSLGKSWLVENAVREWLKAKGFLK